MTAVAPRESHEVSPARPAPFGEAPRGSLAWKMLTTTDHKLLGIMYPVSYTHLTLPTTPYV